MYTRPYKSHPHVCNVLYKTIFQSAHLVRIESIQLPEHASLTSQGCGLKKEFNLVNKHANKNTRSPVADRETDSASAYRSPASAHGALWLAGDPEGGNSRGGNRLGLSVKHDTVKKSAALSFRELFTGARELNTILIV